METNALHTALLARLPEIAEDYKRFVTFLFEKYVSQFGVGLEKIYNSNQYRTFRMVVAPNTTCAQVAPAKFDAATATYTPAAHAYTLNSAKLEENAAKYAKAQVAAWENKIQAKMGELEAAEVNYFDANGGYFTITGVRAGKKVAINQTRILKSSCRGLLFHQFPARIYVEGKFMSEAAYKRSA